MIAELEDSSGQAGEATAYGVPAVLDAARALVLHLRPSELTGVAKGLVSDGYLMCLDVCGVDYLAAATRPEIPPGVKPERFEVTYVFLSHSNRRRLRLRVQVPDGDATLPSLFDLFPGTEAAEREVYDLFGISFDGHPDPTRILMPEEWEGHPLRKDYGVGTVPVRFKAVPDVR